MSLIILDMGSGNGQGNDIAYQKKAIDTIAEIDSKKHKVILKWQLELKPKGNNKPLDPRVFASSYLYANDKGYRATSSVFDPESLVDLMKICCIRDEDTPWGIPFIKIACQSKDNPNVYGMIGLIARGIPIYVSYDPRNPNSLTEWNCTFLACIPEYPAKLSDYPPGIHGYSDHVPGLELWNYYHPAIWEKHFVLEKDANNLDAGPFAITPDQLKEVIG
jgi:sialic acid synthase SpsE